MYNPWSKMTNNDQNKAVKLFWHCGRGDRYCKLKTDTNYFRMQINLRSFKQKVRHHQKAFKKFLGKIEKNPPRHLDKIAEEIDAAVWKEVDCLSCANCCKSMSPTFTNTDIKRIA